MFCRALDGICLVSVSSAMGEEDYIGLQKWFSEYLEWLKTSRPAKKESASRNNHGTYFDVQIMTVALFVGDIETVREVGEAAIEKRILAQVDPDGKQPHEIARTRT